MRANPGREIGQEFETHRRLLCGRSVQRPRDLVEVPSQGEQLLGRMGDGLPFWIGQRRLPGELHANQRDEPVRGSIALRVRPSREGGVLRGREAKADLACRSFAATGHHPMRRRSWARLLLEGLPEQLTQALTGRDLLLCTPFHPRRFEVAEIDGQLRRTRAGHGCLLPCVAEAARQCNANAGGSHILQTSKSTSRDLRTVVPLDNPAPAPHQNVAQPQRSSSRTSPSGRFRPSGLVGGRKDAANPPLLVSILDFYTPTRQVDGRKDRWDMLRERRKRKDQTEMLRGERAHMINHDSTGLRTIGSINVWGCSPGSIGAMS